jgi:hypothetical protein
MIDPARWTQAELRQYLFFHKVDVSTTLQPERQELIDLSRAVLASLKEAGTCKSSNSAAAAAAHAAYSIDYNTNNDSEQQHFLQHPPPPSLRLHSANKTNTASGSFCRSTRVDVPLTVRAFCDAVYSESSNPLNDIDAQLAAALAHSEYELLLPRDAAIELPSPPLHTHSSHSVFKSSLSSSFIPHSTSSPKTTTISHPVNTILPLSANSYPFPTYTGDSKRGERPQLFNNGTRRSTWNRVWTKDLDDSIRIKGSLQNQKIQGDGGDGDGVRYETDDIPSPSCLFDDNSSPLDLSSCCSSSDVAAQLSHTIIRDQEPSVMLGVPHCQIQLNTALSSPPIICPSSPPPKAKAPAGDFQSTSSVVCSACGAYFLSQSSRFCSECGECRRPHRVVIT